MARFSANFAQLADESEAIAKGFDLLARNSHRLAAQGTAILASRASTAARFLTPRSDEEGGNHVADFWSFSVKAEGEGAVAKVFNENTKANEPLRGAPRTTLLHVLEFGTAPHEIEAVNFPHMVFFWEKTGRVERFKKVKHPGTPAFAMLSLAKLAAQEQIPRVRLLFEGAVVRVLSRQQISGSFKSIFESVQNLGHEGIL